MTRATIHRTLCRLLVCSWLGHGREVEVSRVSAHAADRLVFCRACRAIVSRQLDTDADRRAATKYPARNP